MLTTLPISALSALSGPDFLAPLRLFYEHAKQPLPEVEPLADEALPSPYRQLLVHARDMTPTLESFHGDDLWIEVLRRQRLGKIYCREVVLRRQGNSRPAEFGANRINLPAFPSEARWMIERDQLPLGRILKDHDLPHHTRPLAFFRIRADDFIARSLSARPGDLLYGRQARLARPDGVPLSEVVEILPITRGLPPRRL